mgnify:CR=1 FL=1
MSDSPALPVSSAAAQRLALAADPAPSSIERGPTARLHWRHAVTNDPDVADVMADDAPRAEFPALCAAISTPDASFTEPRRNSLAHRRSDHSSPSTCHAQLAPGEFGAARRPVRR